MNQALITRGDSDTILSWGPKGQWSPTENRAYMWGSTHGSSHLKRILRYVESTNTWEADADGTPEIDGQNSHGYFHLAVRASDGKQYIRWYGSNKVSTRVPGGSFSAIAPIVGVQFIDWQDGCGLDWMPSLYGGAGGLVFSAGGPCQTWRESTNTWTIRQTGAADFSASVYNPEDGRVYFGKSSMWAVNADGSVVSRAAFPFAVGSDSAAGQGKLYPAANGGHMVAISSAGSIREYNPTTNAWSAQISTLPFTPSQGLYFSFSDTTHGVMCFIWITGGLVPSTTMHIWKH
jgi:hypothetical protein